MQITIDVGDNYDFAEYLSSIEKLAKTIDSNTDYYVDIQDVHLVIELLDRTLHSIDKDELDYEKRIFIDRIIGKMKTLTTAINSNYGEDKVNDKYINVM